MAVVETAAIHVLGGPPPGQRHASGSVPAEEREIPGKIPILAQRVGRPHMGAPPLQPRWRPADLGSMEPRSLRGRAARPLLACTLAVLSALASGPARAVDIADVLPNSIGLPEVNAVLRPTAGAPPYSGFDFILDPVTNLRMIYDTGASGVILYEGAAQALSIPVAQHMGSDVIFTDVGVGGSTTFNVSQDLHLSFGNFVQEPSEPYTSDDDYPRQLPGLRLQLGPPGSAALFLAEITPLGIVGVPAMAGRVSLIGPKFAEVPFSELTPANTIHTYVYDVGTPPEGGPGILAPDLRVELTLKSFDRFTETTPTGAMGPTLDDNPFIGPDPLAALEGVDPLPTTPPGVTLRLGAGEATGTFLLDSGSQITSISSAMALDLGVRYWAPGDPGYDPGQPATLVYDADASLVPDQFTVDISGIGGTTTIAGFYADSMLLRTLEGDPLVDTDPNHLNFVGAPVYVHDIELLDPVTLDTFTFDGILGTNYLFGSGDLSALSGFNVPFREGPFEWLVLDLASSPPSLGVVFPAPVAVPLGSASAFLTAALLAASGTAMARRSRAG
jgi:hypothetical protein